MNVSEKIVVDYFKKLGFNYTHVGAPDFIFYKFKEESKNKKEKTFEDIDINSLLFREVKTRNHELSHEQQLWKSLLIKLNLNYRTIFIQDGKIRPEDTFINFPEETNKNKSNQLNPTPLSSSLPKSKLDSATRIKSNSISNIDKSSRVKTSQNLPLQTMARQINSNSIPERRCKK